MHSNEKQSLRQKESTTGSLGLPLTNRRFGSWFSRQIEASDEPIGDCVGYLLVAISWILIVATFPFSLMFCLKVIKEYERAVFFRLGRLSHGGARGPGLIFMLPCVDTFRKVDLRVVSFDVPPQEILSKDSVTVTVDAVIYFRISNPIVSVTNVNDAFYSTKLLAQTSLRNILGTKTLSEMLTERDHIADVTEKVLDEGTDPWGVKVERVEMKDIRLPEQLMRAMAAEAEATREARAKVIAAEGEKKSSHALNHAAQVITDNPVALQLRYLQTLNSIAAEHSSTIIFPIPMEIFPEAALLEADITKTTNSGTNVEQALSNKSYIGSISPKVTPSVDYYSASFGASYNMPNLQKIGISGFGSTTDPLLQQFLTSSGVSNSLEMVPEEREPDDVKYTSHKSSISE